MRHPLYLIYGILLLIFLAGVEYGGVPLSGSSINEVKNVPKTVRDNPGAYRSIYLGSPHYVGGK